MSSRDSAPIIPVLQTPTPAPLPPADTGSKAVDSQGIRQVDAESAKSHGLSTAPSRKKEKPSSPKSFSSMPPPTSPARSALHRAALLAPVRPTHLSGDNLYIPCFGMFFTILSSMNDKICSMSALGDSGTVFDWIPQVSILYFSVLIIVHTLRAQKLIGYISATQDQFLDQFLSTFPLDSLEIPGPLVPFFRSISVTKPGFGHFGNVCPIIPPIFWTEEHMYNVSYATLTQSLDFTGITMMLPNISLMLDQFSHLLSFLNTDAAPRHKYSDYTPLTTIFGVNAPEATAPNATHWNRLLTSVGFWDRSIASNGLMDRFARYSTPALAHFPPTLVYNPDHAPIEPNRDANPPVPGRRAAWKVATDFRIMMCSQHSLNWMQTLHLMMSKFNYHWKGNQTLSNISPISSTASMIIYSQVSFDPITSEAPFIHAPNIGAIRRLTFNTSGSTTCPYTTTEDEQDSQIAQLNVKCDHLFGNLRIGAAQVTHFGPFWTASPKVRRSQRADLTESLRDVTTSSAYFRE